MVLNMTNDYIMPPRQAARRLITLLLILLIGGIIAFGSWMLYRQSELERDMLAAYPNDAEWGSINAVTRRLPDGGRGLSPLLWSGRIGIADTVLRAFTSPDYLLKNVSDDAFITDACSVIAGSASKELQRLATDRLDQDGSRLAVINALLEYSGIADRLTLPDQNSTLTRLDLKIQSEPIDGYVLGFERYAAEADMQGLDAEFCFFSDGVYSNSSLVRRMADVTTDGHTLTFDLQWDARYEKGGSHDVRLLVLTGDGRGHVYNQGVRRLPNSVSPNRLADVEHVWEIMGPDGEWGQKVWVRLEPGALESYQAQLLILSSDADLTMNLYNSYSTVKACNVAPARGQAILRAQGTVDELIPRPFPGLRGMDLVFYASLEPTLALNDQGHIRFVGTSHAASRSVEVGSDELDTSYVPVYEVRGERLLVLDERGYEQWVNRDDYDVVDLSAKVNTVRLVTRTGDQLTAPSFTPEMERVAWYAPFDERAFTVSVLPAEGSAAHVTFELTPDGAGALQLPTADREQMGEAGAEHTSFPTAVRPGGSSLIVRVRGFDGQERELTLRLYSDAPGLALTDMMQAFPNSYRTFLWNAYDLHPSWVFEAQEVQRDWEEFVELQDEADRNLVDLDWLPYSWANPTVLFTMETTGMLRRRL